MSTVYIISDYGKISKSGDVLIFTSNDNSIQTIFPHQTDQIILTGKIEITSYALKLIMLHSIETVFLSSNGQFNGKIVFGESKNVFLRKRQFELLNDANFLLSYSKSVANSKVRNQITFLQRTARLRENLSNRITTDINKMKAALKDIEIAKDIDTVRGHEGIAAKYYFNSYKLAIMPEWAEFNGRSRRPPRDNVNAVLSFLYTLLLYRIDSAIQSTGLDPHCGYFHSLNYGSKTLAFDLVEEFRVPLADTVTSALFNSGSLREDNFIKEEFSLNNEEYPLEKYDDTNNDNKTSGVLLTKDGIKKVINRLEMKLDKTIFHEFTGRSIKYRKVFFEQAKHLKRVILGEESTYTPFEIK